MKLNRRGFIGSLTSLFALPFVGKAEEKDEPQSVCTIGYSINGENEEHWVKIEEYEYYRRSCEVDKNGNQISPWERSIK